MKKEIGKHKSEIMALKLQLDDTENDRDAIQIDLDNLLGRRLEGLSLAKCNQLERYNPIQMAYH